MIIHLLDEAKVQMFVTQCYIVQSGPKRPVRFLDIIDLMTISCCLPILFSDTARFWVQRLNEF